MAVKEDQSQLLGDRIHVTIRILYILRASLLHVS